MRGALNLASRPSRNERLPNLAVAIAAVALLLLSAEHVVLLRRVMAAAASERQAEVAGLEAELGRLRQQARDLGTARAAPERIAEWAVVKDIVDRRVFSWSRLLERLAAVLPATTRIVAITPRVEGERVRVELVAVSRTREEGFDLVQLLRDRGGFEEVFPLAVARVDDGEQFTYTLVYRPGTQAPDGPAAEAAS